MEQLSEQLIVEQLLVAIALCNNELKPTYYFKQLYGALFLQSALQ